METNNIKLNTTENIYLKSRKRKITERSLIFTITLIGFLFFFIFDFFFVYSYRIDGYNDLQWFAFWTHLSNTGALVWITLAFVAVLTNNQKIERFINHWNVKNTVFTFIITTGLIFMLVSYIPVVIIYSKSGPINEICELVYKSARQGNLALSNLAAEEISSIIDGLVDPENIESINEAIAEFIAANGYGWGTTPLIGLIIEAYKNDPSLALNLPGLVEGSVFTLENGNTINIDPNVTYRTCVIIGTTIKHLIVPGMFTYLGFTEVGYFRTKNITDGQRSMIQFIWPAMYLVYTMTFISAGIFSPPYPVLDFGFTVGFREMEPGMQLAWTSICFALDLGMGVVFVCTSLFFNWWSSSRVEKYPEIQSKIDELNGIIIDKEKSEN